MAACCQCFPQIRFKLAEAFVSRLRESTGNKLPVAPGGLRTEAGLEMILEKAGLDRAIVGTQALKQPDWFRDMTARFPGRIALGLDARDSKVATGGWLEVSQTPAIELARSYQGMQLAAVIYTNIANDGMMQGIDEATIGDMVELAKLGFPVIASGGVIRLEDIRRLAQTSREHPNLIGAIIGRALYEGTITVREAIVAGRGEIL